MTPQRCALVPDLMFSRRSVRDCVAVLISPSTCSSPGRGSTGAGHLAAASRPSPWPPRRLLLRSLRRRSPAPRAAAPPPPCRGLLARRRALRDLLPAWRVRFDGARDLILVPSFVWLVSVVLVVAPRGRVLSVTATGPWGIGPTSGSSWLAEAPAALQEAGALAAYPRCVRATTTGGGGMVGGRSAGRGVARRACPRGRRPPCRLLRCRPAGRHAGGGRLGQFFDGAKRASRTSALCYLTGRVRLAWDLSGPTQRRAEFTLELRRSTRHERRRRLDLCAPGRSSSRSVRPGSRHVGRPRLLRRHAPRRYCLRRRGR